MKNMNYIFNINMLFGYIFSSITNTRSLRSYFEPLIRSLIWSKFRANLLPTKCISVTHLGNKVYTVTLKIPALSNFEHKAGQHVSIEVELDGRRYQRFFSISSSPAHVRSTKQLELTIKAQPNGLITNYLTQNLRAGDTVHLSTASGDFTLSETPTKKIFIAGGSGISPLLSMLRAMSSAQKQSSKLFYFQSGAISEQLRETFNALEAKGLAIATLDTKIDGHFSSRLIDIEESEISAAEAYICGPNSMISNCRDLLLGYGFDQANIFYEHFGSVEEADLDINVPDAERAITVEFTRSNQSIHVSEGTSKKSLLSVAEGAGLKPLSGCRIGVCRQCVCRKESGRVYNLKTKTISDKAIEEIQLCQSIALTDLVIEA